MNFDRFVQDERVFDKGFGQHHSQFADENKEQSESSSSYRFGTQLGFAHNNFITSLSSSDERVFSSSFNGQICVVDTYSRVLSEEEEQNIAELSADDREELAQQRRKENTSTFNLRNEMDQLLHVTATAILTEAKSAVLEQQQQQRDGGQPDEKEEEAEGQEQQQQSRWDLFSDTIVAGMDDGSMGLWRSQGRNHVEHVSMWFDDHTSKVAQLELKQGLVYSAGHDGFFRVRSLQHECVVHSFIACSCPLSSLVSDGDDLVWLGSWDGQIRQLDLRMKQCVHEWSARGDSESPVRALALGSTPETATLKKRKKKKRKEGDEESAVVEHADPTTAISNLVFAAHGIGEIKCWDTRTNKVLVENYVGHKDVVNCLQVHNGHLFSGSDDRTVRMFDIQKGSLLETLSGHNNGVTHLNLLNEDQLISGGFDRCVRRYDIPAIENAVTIKLLQHEEQRQLALERWIAEHSKKKKKKKTKGGKKKSKKKKKTT